MQKTQKGDIFKKKEKEKKKEEEKGGFKNMFRMGKTRNNQALKKRGTDANNIKLILT